MYQESPTALLEQLLETFTVLDARGVVCSQSPWFERILGYEQGGLTGASVFSLIHPDDRPFVTEAFANATRTPGATVAAEFRFRHRDGTWQVLQAAGKSLLDSAGEIRVVVSARNVTERKQTEEALRESEEQYRDLVENLNDVIYAHDENGILTYISPVIEAFGGYRPEDIVGLPFAQFIHPDDLPAVLSSFQATLNGHLEPSEFRAIAKSGTIRWVRSSSRPVIKDGCIVGVRGVLTDVTERKQAELRTATLLNIARDVSGTLDLKELLYCVEKRTAEALPCDAVATFFWDPQSSVFRLMSQYGFSETLSLHADMASFPMFPVFEQVRGEQTCAWTIGRDLLVDFPQWFVQRGVSSILAAPLLVRERQRGVLLACSTRLDSQFDQEQKSLCDGIARQLAVGIEAAELYQAQQEETAISSALARAGQELIVSVDTLTILQRLCRLTGELLGCYCSYTVLWRMTEEESCQAVISCGGASATAETLHSFKMPRHLISELSERFKSDDIMVLEPGELHHFLVDDAPTPHDVASVLCLALRQGQELIGVQAAGYKSRDLIEGGQKRIACGISQIASLALANARLLEELERANRLKQDFVGTMSHELRTPLNVILGYNELMREGAFGTLSAEQCDILERMNKSATQLLDLINATLDLSRMQSQSVPMSLSRVSVHDLFTDLEAEFRSLHRKSAVKLEWQVEPGLPILQTDPVKLKMVLKNLIGNALKFTDEGVVSTIARAQDNGVTFLVRDTGIGIPSEARTLVFEPFRQVDSSMTRRHGGVGLGLYIVRQLLDLLGGSVSLESELGKGSAFSIWIPQQESRKASSSLS